jgi:hypothetical protein
VGLHDIHGVPERRDRHIRAADAKKKKKQQQMKLLLKSEISKHWMQLLEVLRLVARVRARGAHFEQYV